MEQFINIVVIYLSAYMLFYLFLEVDSAIYMEKYEKIFNPTEDDYQIQVLSNGHIYMGCPAEAKRFELLKEISQESPYKRGYFAYWEGLDGNEVSAIQLKGWFDARDECEKTPENEVSSR